VHVSTSLVLEPLAIGPQMRKDPVGILRLSSFNARAQRDLAAAISDLEGRGAKVM